MKVIAKSLVEFAYYLILTLAGMILSFFALQSLLGGAYIPIRIAEGIRFYQQPWYFYLLLPCFFVFLFLLHKPLERISAKRLFLVASLVYILGAAYLIYFSTGIIRADAKHVFNAALAFNQGDYSSLTKVGAYMYRNPHQLGLLSLERLYQWIYPATQLVFCFNLLFALGNNYLLYRISDLIWSRDRLNKYCILLSFLFLPQFFFILFAYGSIVGIFFALLALYFLIQFNQNNQIFYALGASFALAAACLIRNNYFIFGLTLLVCLLLSSLNDFKWKKLVALGLLLFSISLPNRLISNYYEGQIGRKIGEGTPKISYITMGLRDDPNRQTLGGWYDAYNTKILKRNKYNEKKAEEMAKKDLLLLIQNFVQHPDYAAKFFYEKVKSTWLEPSFQSIWTGPQLERKQKTQTKLLQSLYEEKIGYKIFNSYAMVFLSSLYLLLAAFLIHRLFWAQQALRPFSLYPYIFFLGGFFFHLVWETKSQYVFVYILLLIPTMARSVDWSVERINQILAQLKTRQKDF